jgi:hypothetical protein
VRDCHFPKSRIPARGIRQREQKWQLEHKFGGHLTTAWVGWAVRRDPPLRHENRDVDGEFQLRDFEAGGYFGFSPRLRSDVFDLPIGQSVDWLGRWPNKIPRSCGSPPTKMNDTDGFGASDEPVVAQEASTHPSIRTPHQS